MARCRVCEITHRKAKGESWIEKMCRECYRACDFYTWDHRWDFDYNRIVLPKG